MPKESTIQHYNSSVTGNAPSSGDLSVGEIAINTSDEKVFLKNLGGTVLSLSQTKDLSGTFAFKNQVVSSLNSLTGGLFVTGTANEVEVSASSPNIVVGLPDSVTINNLTVTQNITAEYFVGSLLGKVTVPCKNVESYTLTAGTPVYISGYVGAGASGLLEVKAALAASAAAMPAVGLVEQTLAPNDQGDVVELGLLGSLDTSAFVAGQVAFIAPSGGLTSTRPTSGSHLVQNIGRIVNSSSNQGQIIVLGPGRSNDVPNNITVRGYLEMPNGQTATSLVTTFNGASGAILYSPSLATTSATGVASFNSTYFSVSSGAVSLASAYQATGDTVVGSANIGVTRVGNSVTVTNAGIREFNGLTGTVTLAGDSGSVSLVSGFGVGDNNSYKITNRVASTSLTGVASFDPNTFSVSGTGHVAISTTNATPLGFRDSFGTSLTPKWGSTVTLTGGSGVEVQNTASNVLSFRGITASTSTIGVASFNSTYFSVSSGAVSLASAYQATGDTVITTAGSGIAISTSGKTDTLFNIGVTSFNGSTGAVSYAPPLASASVTGVAHFPSSDFAVSATGSVTLSNVARTNAANTFSGLQTFSNGLSAHGATFGSGSVVRLSGLASFPQVDNGGGIYSGGSIAGEAVNNVYFVAGQGGSGEFPTKPYITFQNNSVDTGADINFSTQGGDVKFTANTDIDIVASNGNVNISSASGGIVIDPVTFVNIAGGVLYVDDTNNRVGINDTTPSMALCVNGGISGGSLIVAAGATFNSRANFAAGLTTANLFVATGATFASTINAPNLIGRWSVITADQTAEVNNGYLTNKATLLTLTLPTTAAVGSMIRVSGMNAGLWKIAQNASQVIHFGKTDTTTGTGGYLLATQTRDSVELVCCVANNEWNVLSSVGNIDFA